MRLIDVPATLVAKDRQKHKYNPPRTYDPWWFTEEGLESYRRVREACERIKTYGY